MLLQNLVPIDLNTQKYALDVPLVLTSCSGQSPRSKEQGLVGQEDF